MDLSKKNTYLMLSAILITIFILNITTFKTGHNWGGDFSGYINQAKSMVDGTIDELVATDEYLLDNTTREVGNILSNWGFPILLTPVYYLFGINIFAMKVAVNIFFILSLFASFMLFRDRLSGLSNILLVLVIAVNTWFFEFKDEILSDIPFLFFSLLSLFLIKRFVISEKIWINKYASYSLLGLCIFFSFSVRTVGLVLLPVLFIVQFVEGGPSFKEKASMALRPHNYIPYIIFILLSLAVTLYFPNTSGSNYLNILMTQNYSKMMKDLAYMSLLPSRFFPFVFLKMNVFGFSYNKYSLVIYGVMMAMVFWGMIRGLKKDYMFSSYVIITLAVSYLFSYRGGERLIVPVFPFFLYFMFLGFSNISLSVRVSDKPTTYSLNADVIIAIGMILVSMAYTAKTSVEHITFSRSGEVIEGPYLPDSIELFNHIKAHTDKAKAVIFHKPKVMALYGERRSAYVNKLDEILGSSAQYIVFDKTGRQYIRVDETGATVKLSLEYIRDKFSCLYENGTFLLCYVKNNTDPPSSY